MSAHDYVIIGAGTSGITLGYLLDKYGHDVVLLEAGEDRDEDPNIKYVKSFYGLEDNFRNEYFWLENGKPNDKLPNDENHFSGGRLWGGGSAVNEGIYWRGTQFVYDQWGGLFADKQFCDDAFVKMETYKGTTENPDLRGDNGPFQVIQSKNTPIGDTYVDNLHKILKNKYHIDAPVVQDLHSIDGPALCKQGQHAFNDEEKTRVSTSSALIKGRGRKLNIQSRATVLNIIFDGNKAVGVKYFQDGQVKTVYANHKVILCAGPRSPIILMHSGVWAADSLSSLKIPVVFDNPKVGQNLLNHLLMHVKLYVPEEHQVDDDGDLPFKGFSSFSVYPDVSNRNINEIDIETTCLALAPGISTFSSILVNPKSRGHLSICSRDPLHPFVIESNYFGDPDDKKKMINALQITEDVIKSISSQDSRYKLISDLSNKDEYVRQNTTHVHHWVGTCGIGDVIDEHLSVYGVENLMVADTSAMPVIPRGHTYIPAILTGVAAFVEITGNRDWDF